MQTLPRTGRVQHVEIGLGGDGESVRDADALPGQLLEHLAQRRVLSADKGHVFDAELLKKADVPGSAHDLSSRRVKQSAPSIRPTRHAGSESPRIVARQSRNESQL